MKKLFLLAAISLLIISCALRPIGSQYSFIKIDVNDVELDSLGNGKILFYNGADILHRMDNTARLNIWIEDKSLGQLRGGEYVIIQLNNAEYNVKLHHQDVFNMRSEHKVIVNDTVKVIRVEPTITSNKLSVTNELPKKFEKFKYTEAR